MAESASAAGEMVMEVAEVHGVMWAVLPPLCARAAMTTIRRTNTNARFKNVK